MYEVHNNFEATSTNNCDEHEQSSMNVSFLSSAVFLDYDSVSDPNNIFTSHMKELIKHKDFIIKQLQENIKLLKNQLSKNALSRDYNVSLHEANTTDVRDTVASTLRTVSYQVSKQLITAGTTSRSPDQKIIKQHQK